MMLNDETKAWQEIVKLDRAVEMPEDPTLRRAAVWWEVFSRLPDEPRSRLWATYVADAWEHSTSILDELPAAVPWIDLSAEEHRDRVADAKARYDAVTGEWWAGSADWTDLETEKSRRLVRLVIAMQQRLVALTVEQGQLGSETVRERLAHPYVAGYLSGLAMNWCDGNGIDHRDERCRTELRQIFREMFGPELDDAAATIFFERWSGEVDCVDGMLHAHEDVNSFRRWERGVRIQPRMRLFEHLTA